MTNATKKIQLRGICQCCGREQAVVSGRMSKHGYTVEQGWFSGVCTGQNYMPMQKSRTTADEIIATVRNECVGLRAYAKSLEAGEVTPAQAKSGKYNMVRHPKHGYMTQEFIMVPYADAPTWEQEEALRSAIWKNVRRAEMGESFADSLEKIANEYHGKELREVVLGDAPAPILRGEQRGHTDGDTLICTKVDGPRVYYTWGDKKRTVWMGTASWRKLALVK